MAIKEHIRLAGEVVGEVTVRIPLRAIANPGFLKAVGYSFGSWGFLWLLQWLTTSEAIDLLGSIGWVIPLINVIAVFFKKYFDELQV